MITLDEFELNKALHTIVRREFGKGSWLNIDTIEFVNDHEDPDISPNIQAYSVKGSYGNGGKGGITRRFEIFAAVGQPLGEVAGMLVQQILDVDEVGDGK